VFRQLLIDRFAKEVKKMDVKKLLITSVTTFAAALVANATVVYLRNLIFHGQGSFEWGRSFSLAIVLGIVLPVVLTIMDALKRKRCARKRSNLT